MTATEAASTKEIHTPSATERPTQDVVAPTPTLTQLVDRVAFLGFPIPPDYQPDELAGVPPLNLYLAEPQGSMAASWSTQTLLTVLTDSQRLSASPDGRQLAFVGVLDDDNGDGYIAPAGEGMTTAGDFHHVYVYQLADRSLQRLGDLQLNQWAFAWSPDSQAVAYEQSGSLLLGGLNGTSTQQIASDIPAANQLAWSPDGRTIAVETVSDHLILIELTARRQREVQLPAHTSLELAWSPDSSRLALIPRVSGVETLFLLDPDTLGLKPLAEAFYISSPSWSPDGRQIAVGLAPQSDSNPDVYVVDTATGDLRNLSNHPARDDYPFWAPHQNWILFHTDRDDRIQDIQTRLAIYSLDPDTGKTQVFVGDSFLVNNFGLAWLTGRQP